MIIFKFISVGFKKKKKIFESDYSKFYFKRSKKLKFYIKYSFLRPGRGSFQPPHLYVMSALIGIKLFKVILGVTCTHSYIKIYNFKNILNIYKLILKFSKGIRKTNVGQWWVCPNFHQIKKNIEWSNFEEGIKKM